MYKHYVKRWLDIGISGIGLMLLSPAIGILALLVRVKLGSPVIFHQERPGYGAKIFTLRKFGRLLRRTSLDELPELWNIFRGDMSLIGPRPLLVSYLPYYTKREQLRHTVRPGLTGLAQVSGRNYLEWDKRLEKDVEYVENLSFGLDIKIFFTTIKQIFVHEDVAEDTDLIEGNLAEIRKGKEWQEYR